MALNDTERLRMLELEAKFHSANDASSLPDPKEFPIQGRVAAAAHPVMEMAQGVKEAFTGNKDVMRPVQESRAAAKTYPMMDIAGDFGTALALPFSNPLSMAASSGIMESLKPGSPKERAERALEAAGTTFGVGKGMEHIGGKLAAKQTQEAAETAMAKKGQREAYQVGQQAGYAVPPSHLGKGTKGTALETAGAGDKAMMDANFKNQPITDKLAKQALGVNPQTDLTPAFYDAYKKQYGKAYEAVRQWPNDFVADKTFDNEIKGIFGKAAGTASRFPKAMNYSDQVKDLVDELKNIKTINPDDAMNLVQRMREQSSRIFKAEESRNAAFDQNQIDTAFALRKSANAVEGLIERGLTGTPLYNDFIHARTKLAIMHDIEDATQVGSGNVMAHKLAAMYQKGKPMSGELETIAKFAQNFPKVTRLPSSMGPHNPYSMSDVGWAALLGGAAEAGSGNPKAWLAMGGVLGRPLFRNRVLSPSYQQSISESLRQPPGPKMSGRLMDDDAIRRATSILSGQGLAETMNPSEE